MLIIIFFCKLFLNNIRKHFYGTSDKHFSKSETLRQFIDSHIIFKLNPVNVSQIEKIRNSTFEAVRMKLNQLRGLIEKF